MKNTALVILPTCSSCITATKPSTALFKCTRNRNVKNKHHARVICVSDDVSSFNTNWRRKKVVDEIFTLGNTFSVILVIIHWIGISLQYLYNHWQWVSRRQWTQLVYTLHLVCVYQTHKHVHGRLWQVQKQLAQPAHLSWLPLKHKTMFPTTGENRLLRR